MKQALTILLVFSFIGVAVFSVLAMGHEAGRGHVGCLALTASGIDCAKEDALSSIVFHFNTFRSFSLATFGDNLASALIWLFALALIIGLRTIAGVQPIASIVAASQRHRHFLESRHSPFQREFTHWLALHENSPALI